MQQVTSREEYLDLVDQVLFEVDEMIVCADDEDEVDPWFTEIRSKLEEVAQALRTLHTEVKSGTHAFGDGQDLPFMPLVRELKDRLPINPLFEALNRFHKSGI